MVISVVPIERQRVPGVPGDVQVDVSHFRYRRAHGGVELVSREREIIDRQVRGRMHLRRNNGLLRSYVDRPQQKDFGNGMACGQDGVQPLHLLRRQRAPNQEVGQGAGQTEAVNASRTPMKSAATASGVSLPLSWLSNKPAAAMPRPASAALSSTTTAR